MGLWAVLFMGPLQIFDKQSQHFVKTSAQVPVQQQIE